MQNDLNTTLQLGDLTRTT